MGSGTNSATTQDIFDISGEFDMDAICGTLEFRLPYFIKRPDGGEQGPSPETGVNLNRLKKFDQFRLFFGEFDTDPGEITSKKIAVEREINAPEEVGGVPVLTTDITEEVHYYAGGKELSVIFDGFLDQIKLSKAKENIEYRLIALGTLGMANYRNMEYEKQSGALFDPDTGGGLIPQMLQVAGLQKGYENITPVPQNIIPLDKIQFIDTSISTFEVSTDGGVNLKEALESIRKKYGLIIHQGPDGVVQILTPLFLLNARGNSSLDVNAWSFSLDEGTLFEIDYGDLTNQYNAVVVLGANTSQGVAVDVAAVENNGGNVNYLIHENRDLASDEDCERVAKEKLLEISKNFIVTVKTKFQPEFRVCQPIRFVDHDRFTGNELFLIKKFTFRIDKNDVSCQVIGFCNSITLIPEDVVLESAGVLDMAGLGIKEKETDVTQWKNLG